MSVRNAALVALGIGLVVGFWFGNRHGYQQAAADVKQVQEAAASKAADNAANAANPFKAANPLQNVQANPFAKAKQVLNPF